MKEKSVDLLFEYLRSILYDSKVKPLDIDALDDEHKKIGQGLQYLDEALKQMKAYSYALAKGNLSVEVPPRENQLCENLKAIHANLNHLTWQAKQVSKGDYSQTVSYLGEFSDAFNTMTQQLKERELNLKRETEIAQKYVEMLNVKNQELEVEAILDELTQIGNRHFFIKEMELLLSLKRPFILCYCDLDHLKYVNDNYGHAEGDSYISRFVELIKAQLKKDDIFARIGGDEFCIIYTNKDFINIKEIMGQLQSQFCSDRSNNYDQSFSCGIIEIQNNDDTITLETILNHADALMYEQKKLHKCNR